MNKSDNVQEIDFENSIAMRMDAIIERKRAENEIAIARIATLDTAWTDVNGDIDKDFKTGLDSARVEAQAMQDAKERLTRNVCGGVDKKEFGLAGKVVDTKSNVGLPGLTVTIALATDGAGKNFEAETDSYGDFFFSFEPDAAVASKTKGVSAVIAVGLDTKTVHREERPIEPKPGAIEHLTLKVECSGKLKDVLEQGKEVAASVEGDVKLVEARVANFDAAYSVFQRLSETTLSQMRGLREELSVAPPQAACPAPAIVASVTSADEPTQLLGNSHARELHDLQNTKTNCRINQISADHRVFFKTEEDAIKAGYDYCYYCFGKGKSMRISPLPKPESGSSSRKKLQPPPAPKPKSKPAPKPVAKPKPKPKAKPVPKPVAKPKPKPGKPGKPAVRPKPAPKTAPKPQTKRKPVPKPRQKPKPRPR
ncbi:MAG: hypothetical protein ACKVQW_09510 [Pyrinomonadaceae bacterium]